jgi:hypothetical protein
VGNDFLDFFEKYGGLDIFGYPIENATVEANVGVQYFQRARLELRPEQSATYRIQLGLLGQQIYGRIDAPLPPEQRPAATDRNHRFFPETGQVVSFAFLDFFNSRGGLDIFGFPISGQITEKGITVQYFQRARMEWRPESAPQYRVQLGLLGAEAFSQRGQIRPTPSLPVIVTPQPTKPWGQQRPRNPHHRPWPAPPNPPPRPPACSHCPRSSCSWSLSWWWCWWAWSCCGSAAPSRNGWYGGAAGPGARARRERSETMAGEAPHRATRPFGL